MKKFLLMTIILAFLTAAPAALLSAGNGLFDLKSVDVGNISDSGSAEVEIELKNITGSPLNIEKVDTSCGCTVVNASDNTIAPGETTRVRVTIDTRGKMGEISKELKLFTSGSNNPHVLTLKGKIEHFGDKMPDPGVIFEGDCATCHVGENVEEKHGHVLYNSVCFICHKKGLSPEAAGSGNLEAVIADGIPGTSMPGFSKKAGGPLDIEQVRTLTEYSRKTFSKGN